MDKLRFPIGKYRSYKGSDKAILEEWKGTLASFYLNLENAVSGLNKEQLNQTYRPGGWTIKQLVHHLADSHMNAIIRFKLALTESKPTIKPYLESEWAKLDDYTHSIESSLKIIEGVHLRWIELLNAMTGDDFKKSYLHPEHGAEFDLMEAVCQYDWHCRHHLAHIELAKKH